MNKASPGVTDAQKIFLTVLDQICSAQPDFGDVICGMRRMAYADVKMALNFSEQFGRLATPSGATPLYLELSRVKNGGMRQGCVNRRAQYYTRGIDDLEDEQLRLSAFARVSNKTDYLEGAGRFKQSKSDDVQFIVTNMGRTRQERQKTAGLIEAAEKSVKEGGKRRRHVNNATLMSSAIIALPHEISTDARKRIAERVCKMLEGHGVFYLAVGHKPSSRGDQRNHHLHLIFSQRPFSRGVANTVEFADKIDRDLQHPRFLRDLRQLTAEASNKALSESNHNRRVFAGTYADNGLPFAQARKRIPIRAYQAARSEQTNRPADGHLLTSSANDELTFVRLMADVVNIVDARIAVELKLNAAAEKAKAARMARTKAIDDAMTSLISDGILFAVDRETKKVKLADIRLRSFRRFVDATIDATAWPRHNRRLTNALKIAKRLGSDLDTWIATRSPLVMKSWSRAPDIALQAIRTLGGTVQFSRSGALSVTPTNNTWTGNGLLSWLADAIRNHCQLEITSALLQQDFDPKVAADLPTAGTDTINPAFSYAKELFVGGPNVRNLLAQTRTRLAEITKQKLALDNLKMFDAELETQLLKWRQGPFLVQKHREALFELFDEDVSAPELSKPLTEFSGALELLGRAAKDRSQSLRDPIRCVVAAAYRLFGPKLWKSRLESSMTELFDEIKWNPAQSIVGSMSTYSVTLADQTLVTKQELGDLAENAFEETNMRQQRLARWQQKTQAERVR
jgi:hypothetical protein